MFYRISFLALLNVKSEIWDVHFINRNKKIKQTKKKKKRLSFFFYYFIQFVLIRCIVILCCIILITDDLRNIQNQCYWFFNFFLFFLLVGLYMIYHFDIETVVNYYRLLYHKSLFNLTIKTKRGEFNFHWHQLIYWVCLKVIIFEKSNGFEALRRRRLKN